MQLVIARSKKSIARVGRFLIGDKGWYFLKQLIRFRFFAPVAQRLFSKIYTYLGGLEQELERAKVRITQLDSKLNLVLYGMPRTDDYAVRLVTEHYTTRFDYFDARKLLLKLRGDEQSTRHRYARRIEALKTVNLSGFKGFNPRTYLDIGCGSGLVTDAFLGGFPSIQSVVGVDFDDETLAMVSDAAVQKKVLKTDAITAFKLSAASRFDLITCIHLFEHLSPHEQIALLGLAYQALNPGGIFYLETPNVLNLSVLRDYFWIDPQHLRPFSSTLMIEVLGTLAPGKFEWAVWGDDARLLAGQQYYDREFSGQDREYLDLFFAVRRT